MCGLASNQREAGRAGVQPAPDLLDPRNYQRDPPDETSYSRLPPSPPPGWTARAKIGTDSDCLRPPTASDLEGGAATAREMADSKWAGPGPAPPPLLASAGLGGGEGSAQPPTGGANPPQPGGANGANTPYSLYGGLSPVLSPMRYPYSSGLSTLFSDMRTRGGGGGPPQPARGGLAPTPPAPHPEPEEGEVGSPLKQQGSDPLDDVLEGSGGSGTPTSKGSSTSSYFSTSPPKHLMMHEGVQQQAGGVPGSGPAGPSLFRMAMEDPRGPGALALQQRLVSGLVSWRVNGD